MDRFMVISVAFINNLLLIVCHKFIIMQQNNYAAVIPTLKCSINYTFTKNVSSAEFGQNPI